MGFEIRKKLDKFMEFEIKKVLDMNINSIPGGAIRREIDISLLKTKKDREILRIVLLNCFDKNPSYGSLDGAEQRKARGTLGDKIIPEQLNEIASEIGAYKKQGKLTVLQLIGALEHGDEVLRKNAAKSLGEMGRDAKAAVHALVKALKDKNLEVSEKAANALVRIGSPTVPVLIEALKDKDFYVRKKAAWALGEIGDRGAVSPLIKMMGDKNKDVCVSAANALIAIGSPAVPPLIKLLSDKKNAHDAAIALSLIDDKRVVPALIEALKDPDWRVRSDAASGLGMKGHEAEPAIPFLIEALKDENWVVRSIAAKALGEIIAKALGKIDDRRVIRSLVKARKDKNGFVRVAAAKALKRMRGR